jgi:hypothetical protein
MMGKATDRAVAKQAQSATGARLAYPFRAAGIKIIRSTIT